jgi:hypothetical protein
MLSEEFKLQAELDSVGKGKGGRSNQASNLGAFCQRSLEVSSSRRMRHCLLEEGLNVIFVVRVWHNTEPFVGEDGNSSCWECASMKKTFSP